MKRLKIVIVGNSVAMRVRPPLKHPKNLNYTTLLQNLLEKSLTNYNVVVSNKAKGAMLTSEILSDIDLLIREFPDYYVINTGVVDASTREIPYWFYKRVNKQVKSTFEYLLSGVYANIFMRYRPFFVKLRGNKTWISQKQFEDYFNLIISLLLKETNSRIIALSINPANDRIEKQLPGSRSNQKAFNEIIKTTIRKNGQIFIDTTSILNEEDYPDGIHYSSDAHHLIAIKLHKIIINDIFENIETSAQ